MNRSQLGGGVRRPLFGMSLALLVGLPLWATAPVRGADDGKFEKYVLSPSFGVLGVVPSADGRRAVVAVGDTTLRIWNLEKGEELAQWKAHKHPAINGVAFGPDGKHVFSCSEDGTVRQWEAASGKEVREFQGHPVGVKALGISPSGKRLLTAGSDGLLRLFDVGSGKLEHMMRIPDGIVEAPFVSVAFAPGGERALAGNAKGHVSLWDLKTGRQVNLFSGHKGTVLALAILPDGKGFVSGDGADGSIRVWSMAAVKVTRMLQGHDGPVSSVAVSADGARLVSGGADKMVRVWDLKTGNELCRLAEHTKAVTRVAFVGNKRVISGGEDGAVIVWQLPK